MRQCLQTSLIDWERGEGGQNHYVCCAVPSYGHVLPLWNPYRVPVLWCQAPPVLLDLYVSHDNTQQRVAQDC
jgi:hypothetical protein